MSPTPKHDIIRKVEDASPQKEYPKGVDTMMPRIPLFANAGRVKVYCVSAKDDLLQIIGAIRDKIVVIETKICRSVLTAHATLASQIEQVWNTIKEKTVRIQDGYVYVTAIVEGQVVRIKAKVVEPIKSCTLACCNASSSRMELVLQKLKPCSAKVHDGFASIVATIDQTKVFIQVQTSTTCANLKMRALSTLDGFSAAIGGYVNPLRSRSISLYRGVSAKVDHIFICITNGVVHMKGVVGQRLLHVQTSLSELAIRRHMATGLKTARQTISNLSAKVLEMVSNAYGVASDAVERIQCNVKDGVIRITALINDQVVHVRVKIACITDRWHTCAQNSFAAACTKLVDTCNGAKTRAAYATEMTRIRAIEVGTNIRSVAANPDARAAAAGAVALGASGGATGLVAGGLVGAVCAVPAAFFYIRALHPSGSCRGSRQRPFCRRIGWPC
jgi:hypothetical protein